MKLVLLGVRGSTPAPGAEFVRYGGHTSSVAVYADGATDPALVLDAGTGLRSLTARLSTPAFTGSILLSHLHWDHVQGLPFFTAGDQQASVVDVYLPGQRGESARQLLTRMMSPPSFPLGPDGLNGTWSLHALDPGCHEIAGFVVHAAEIRHKGGRTFGYRIEDSSGAVAYLPDHSPVQGCSAETRALVAGADVLLHDSQFLQAEQAAAHAYGHATVGEAISLADDGEVERLVLFHHAPARTDEQLDQIAASDEVRRAPIPVVLAREGDEIVVG